MDEEEIMSLTASLTAAVDFYEWSGGAGSRIARMRTLLDRAAESREPLARLLLARVGELLISFGVDPKTSIGNQETPDTAMPAHDQPADSAPTQPLLSLFHRPLPTAAARRDPSDMQVQLDAQDKSVQRADSARTGVVRDTTGVLRAGQIFRRRAQMRAAETLLAEAIATKPESPGPLNPETLAWRALKTMEELAPAYLTRMVSYVESLVWVEEAAANLASTSKAAPRKTRRRKGDADGQKHLL